MSKVKNKEFKSIFKEVINDHENIGKRIRREVLTIQKNSNLLLMLPHTNLKGISSRLFTNTLTGKQFLQSQQSDLLQN